MIIEDIAEEENRISSKDQFISYFTLFISESSRWRVSVNRRVFSAWNLKKRKKNEKWKNDQVYEMREKSKQKKDIQFNQQFAWHRDWTFFYLIKRMTIIALTDDDLCKCVLMWPKYGKKSVLRVKVPVPRLKRCSCSIHQCSHSIYCYLRKYRRSLLRWHNHFLW